MLLAFSQENAHNATHSQWFITIYQICSITYYSLKLIVTSFKTYVDNLMLQYFQVCNSSQTTPSQNILVNTISHCPECGSTSCWNQCCSTTKRTAWRSRLRSSSSQPTSFWRQRTWRSLSRCSSPSGEPSSWTAKKHKRTNCTRSEKASRFSSRRTSRRTTWPSSLSSTRLSCWPGSRTPMWFRFLRPLPYSSSMDLNLK